jgi:hypothetical protein
MHGFYLSSFYDRFTEAVADLFGHAVEEAPPTLSLSSLQPIPWC